MSRRAENDQPEEEAERSRRIGVRIVSGISALLFFLLFIAAMLLSGVS